MNYWHKVSDTFWQCLNYDVWLEDNIWQAATMFGEGLGDKFKSAEETMNFVDEFSKKWW